MRILRSFVTSLKRHLFLFSLNAFDVVFRSS